MFSNSCKYGLRAVLYLAVNSDESNKLKVEDLAKALDMPKHFLAKILQQLTKHQIISSLKGRNGGFYLNEKNRNSRLLVVIEAIDGPMKMQDCILGLSNCSDSCPCPYHEAFGAFKTNFYNLLYEETIDKCSKRINDSKLRLTNLM